MPPADTLDLAALLAPVAGPDPAGADLRVGAGPGSPYYLVKDARTLARAAERSMENGDEGAAPADWKPVATHAVAALTAKTKDLELAAYLIEAQLRQHGFAGLRDAFAAAAGLVRGFWDQLYPRPDEDGIATTLSALAGLNGDDAPGTLIAPLYRVPLTDSASHGRLSYTHYLQALATQKVLDPKAREKKIADGAMTFERLRAAVEDTPVAVVRKLFADLTACRTAFDDYTTALDQKAAADSPPGGAIRTALEAVLAAVKDLGGHRLVVAAPPPEAAAADAPAATGGAAANAHTEPAGEKLPVVRNRDDALTAAQQLADYFRRNEPQSLVPFALEQAVRWGRMSVAELLTELIPDEKPRQALFKQAGLTPVKE